MAASHRHLLCKLILHGRQVMLSCFWESPYPVCDRVVWVKPFQIPGLRVRGRLGFKPELPFGLNRSSNGPASIPAC